MRVGQQSRLAAVAIGAAAALACAQLVIHVPARDDPTVTGPQPDLQAGASRVDLTPIPGIPLGGYSTEGKVSRGFWTRLGARSIYLEDAGGKSLVVVTTDLMIMPAGLADRVVALLHEPTGGLPPGVGVPLTRIGRENLLLAATETHQSPGNFFDSELYNSYSSAQAGFDTELFEFLARQITKGIKLAYHDREEAVLRTSHFTGPTADAYVIDEFVRNRSLDAFLLNAEAQHVLAANATRLSLCPVADPDWPRDYADPRACRAVHARVDLLELLGKTSLEPIALAVIVPAHITMLDAQSEVYASDLFGLAATMLESRMGGGSGCGKNSATPPVVGVFNGAQGDVSLWWRRHDREEALALSKQLVDHVCNRLAAGLRDPGAPSLGFQFDYVSVANRSFTDAEGYSRTTESRPAMGAPELGGAEDQRTVLYDLGQREGVRHYVRREHGAKQMPLLIELPGIEVDLVGDMFRSQEPPDVAPLGVFRIGDVALVGFPSEPTTVMGLRIREEVATAMTIPSANQVLLVSFANGHISYVTTPQEYDRQTYEGASNYWGPATGPLLQWQAGLLAASLGKISAAPMSAAPKAWTRSYHVGAEWVFELRNAWGPPYDPDEGLANIAVQGGDPYRKFPTFCWRDHIPSLGTGSPECARALPDVRIADVSTNETFEIDGLAQDNRGFGLVTAMVAVSREETEWCAVWLRPEGSVPPSPTSTCRFSVDRISGPSVASDAFACANGAPFSRPRDSSNALLPPLVPNDGSHWLCKWPLDVLLGACSTTCTAGAL